MAVTIPGPPRRRVEFLAARSDVLEAGAVDTPDVALARGQRPPVGQVRESLPGHGDLGRPAAVGPAPAVEHAIHMHGVAQSG